MCSSLGLLDCHRGAYTAHNASYSHNYTYNNTQDSTRQMFLVNLLRGVALDMGATQDQVCRRYKYC